MYFSGPLERSTTTGVAAGSRGSTPPNLSEYSSAPVYDLATIVQQVGVRSMILRSWEQQFGIPAPVRIQDDVSGIIQRYSERDLVAAIWLRDQVIHGVNLNAAVALLLMSQPPNVGTEPEQLHQNGAPGMETDQA